MYRNEAGRVFVAGSAHLDVLAKVTGDDVTIDKIGRVAIEIGGTGCNIAMNLAALGLKPRLLTAMQEDSPYSGIITAHLHSHGVDVIAVHSPDMQAAVFSAHIGRNGEMMSAVSAMPVETAVFPVETVREAMMGSQCAILECNLSGSTLNEFALIAQELGIPVFVASVSEEKGLRMSAITTPLAGVFMNRRESAYFGAHIVGSTLMSDIALRMKCPLIVSCDRDGVVLIENEMRTHIHSAAIEENVHTLGAGDALLAATVAHHVFGAIDLAQAIEKSVTFAAGIISKTNCSASNSHAIESALNSLDRLATRDPMTGLSNRRSGEQTLTSAHKKSLSSSSPYSILMVDIDFFKRVNDVFGHDVGDDAIKAVAFILNQTVRGGDVACRWGGEEFLCILKEADAETAALVAERIRVTVESTEIPVVGKITVSIGVATWAAGRATTSFQELIKVADQGLYAAKQGGRNQVAVNVQPASEEVAHES